MSDDDNFKMWGKAVDQLCEACERFQAAIVDTHDSSEHPYRICNDCHTRLHERSLRPLEWYNLAKRHGWWQFLLHDDFYDEDGTAVQPEGAVKDAEKYPAPSLGDVCSNTAALLDYTVTRWSLEPAIVKAWKEIPESEVLSILPSRFEESSSTGIRDAILTICSAAVGEKGADFVRQAWSESLDRVSFTSLVRASAKCLPASEGLQRAIDTIEGLSGMARRDAMLALGDFHSPRVLDWIEVEITEPLTETWSNLAAASQIDWPRIKAWIEKGRPLSLVAIDVLLAIARPMTPFLREYNPSLISPPDDTEFREMFSTYRERDPVPRVQNRIDTLLTSSEMRSKLTKPKA